MKFTTMVILIAVMGPTSPVAAQGKGGSNPLIDAVTTCKSERDDAKRLRCYDAAAGSLDQASKDGKIVVVSREEVRRTRRSLFGFSLPKLPFFRGDDTQDETPDEIDAVIASVQPAGRGLWLLTLDSGARWRTTDPDPNRDPRSGDKIKIKKGALNGYFLSIGGRRSVKGVRIG